ncbi:MAG: A/G-specific adenine glycosylase [Rhodobacteraceae bacterium]|nr:A/G-specific adenine glycosylase [Paracoccaceae bacterium]
MRDDDRAAALLDWYDAHAREMPWRVGPAARRAGARPDPYHVWLSEIMLQQTTVAAVRDYFRAFVTKWPGVTDLAMAEDAEVMGAWAGLGYYARARNLLKCARIVATEYGGWFPDTHDALLKLPGIGPYTAAAVASIAFDRPETVVDGNVERVMARLFDVHTPLPTAKGELTELAAKLTPTTRPGDYAQAVMDLGATICTPRNPACGICPWSQGCAGRSAGHAESLPAKLPKTPKPVRLGYVYLVQRNDGAWLLETRPDKGLLGGMLGWPVSEWSENPVEDPPLAANWQDPGAEVRHTFTHFHLRLSVRTAVVSVEATPLRGRFVERGDFRPSDLPTLMRKAFDLASEAVAGN